ncbi:dephospho-CoA kinase [Spiroplasma sp. NBRC 100390]|uniref:dephospho-CoA kinase n=1 Tax=unclassified Spiroplasma TaxID=2637901 RepID=UPI0008928B01|nr:MULTISPECIES: dephospho-CoA kinase [unclassified Spiroplasma]AOX44152.1 dephospho-CoA kinase [Spiroplasma sp. TU-14]APE13622.1 dephospho-CoA kinase [Spiroplasma sp. NBRC 100390]
MIIGIYGYIGTGKTSACEYLQNKYHLTYLNADQIAKEIMQEKTTLMFLNKTFPGVVKNEVLDRSYLRTIIFTNQTANTKLNNYLWPKVSDKILTIINDNPLQNFLIEAVGINILPVTFKAKILITAREETILARIAVRDQQPAGQTKQLLKIQKNLFKDIKPDYQIETTESLQFLYDQLDKIMKEILGDKQ